MLARCKSRPKTTATTATNPAARPAMTTSDKENPPPPPPPSMPAPASAKRKPRTKLMSAVTPARDGTAALPLPLPTPASASSTSSGTRKRKRDRDDSTVRASPAKPRRRAHAGTQTPPPPPPLDTIIASSPIAVDPTSSTSPLPYAPASPDLTPATVLPGGYTVQSILGRGNFSTTYLASSPSAGAGVVAIKRLQRPFGVIGENEAALLASLFAHDDTTTAPPRHIVRLLASFWVGSCFHLVLEPLDAARPLALPPCTCFPTSSVTVAHTPLACPRRHRALAKVLVQMAGGLHALHARGLIHADLTPSNVLYTRGANTLKLLDLGNTIRPADRPAYTADYNLQTACYRAPEILLGAGPVDTVVDVFSLGVIAAELLLQQPDDAGAEAGVVVVVGDTGVEGAELLRPAQEGREGMVRRVVELLGSVNALAAGLYWKPVYAELSSRWAFVRGVGKRVVGEKTGCLERVLLDECGGGGGAGGDRRGSTASTGGLSDTAAGGMGNALGMGSALWVMADEAGRVPAMVALLARMLAVDPARRASAVDVLRDPWLVHTLLGDWGDVLLHMGGGGGVNGVNGVNGVAGGVDGRVGGGGGGGDNGDNGSVGNGIGSVGMRERGEARKAGPGSIRTARTYTTATAATPPPKRKPPEKKEVDAPPPPSSPPQEASVGADAGGGVGFSAVWDRERIDLGDEDEDEEEEEEEEEGEPGEPGVRVGVVGDHRHFAAAVPAAVTAVEDAGRGWEREREQDWEPERALEKEKEEVDDDEDSGEEEEEEEEEEEVMLV